MAENIEKVESNSDARRRVLNIAVSTVLLETGFDAADKMSLETLTEILQCCELSDVVRPTIENLPKIREHDKSKVISSEATYSKNIRSMMQKIYEKTIRQIRTEENINSGIWRSPRKCCFKRNMDDLDKILTEVGNSARGYCELSGRVEPVLGDVVMALVNMGISLQNIEQYAARPNRHVIQPPQQAPAPRTPAMLSAGSKAKLAPHIPFHLPPLPDPHAYIRTPTHKQPVTEYEAIREKAATQKRDIERALTKFLAKTSETHNLFNTEDNQVFPLIACKPTFPAYLPCLLPTDQVFDFDELEYHFQVANRTEDLPADKKDQSDNEGENGGDNDNANNSQSENQDTPAASSPERSKTGG